jgi:hypothetical protein
MANPKRRDAYGDLVRHLVARKRRDLIVPMASARTAVAALEVAIDIVARQPDARTATRRLKIEYLKQRRMFESAAFAAVEAISDEPDGSDLVSALMGEDGDRLLADILLD